MYAQQQTAFRAAAVIWVRCYVICWATGLSIALRSRRNDAWLRLCNSPICRKLSHALICKASVVLFTKCGIAISAFILQLSASKVAVNPNADIEEAFRSFRIICINLKGQNLTPHRRRPFLYYGKQIDYALTNIPTKYKCGGLHNICLLSRTALQRNRKDDVSITVLLHTRRRQDKGTDGSQKYKQKTQRNFQWEGNQNKKYSGR